MDLISDLKNLRNMTMTVAPIVVGTLGTVPKCSEKKLGRLEISERIKTYYDHCNVLRLARILRRVLETREDFVTQTSVTNHQLKLEKNPQRLK